MLAECHNTSNLTNKVTYPTLRARTKPRSRALYFFLSCVPGNEVDDEMYAGAKCVSIDRNIVEILKKVPLVGEKAREDWELVYELRNTLSTSRWKQYFKYRFNLCYQVAELFLL